MAWLAKELKPFSISPIMFCHIATGSLLLSAIGALQRNHRGLLSPAFWLIPHCCDGTVKIAGVILIARCDLSGTLPHQSLLQREKPCHRVLSSLAIEGAHP